MHRPPQRQHIGAEAEPVPHAAKSCHQPINLEIQATINVCRRCEWCCHNRCHLSGLGHGQGPLVNAGSHLRCFVTSSSSAMITEWGCCGPAGLLSLQRVTIVMSQQLSRALWEGWRRQPEGQAACCSHKPLPQPPEDSLGPTHLWRVGGGHLQTRNARPQRSISSNGCFLLAQPFHLPGGRGMTNGATLKAVLTISDKLANWKW